MEEVRIYESDRIVATNKIMLLQGRLQILKEDLVDMLNKGSIDEEEHKKAISTLHCKFSEMMRQSVEQSSFQNSTKVLGHHYDDEDTQSYIIVFPIESNGDKAYPIFFDKVSEKFFLIHE